MSQPPEASPSPPADPAVDLSGDPSTVTTASRRRDVSATFSGRIRLTPMARVWPTSTPRTPNPHVTQQH